MKTTQEPELKPERKKKKKEKEKKKRGQTVNKYQFKNGSTFFYLIT